MYRQNRGLTLICFFFSFFSLAPRVGGILSDTQTPRPTFLSTARTDVNFQTDVISPRNTTLSLSKRSTDVATSEVRSAAIAAPPTAELPKAAKSSDAGDDLTERNDIETLKIYSEASDDLVIQNPGMSLCHKIAR
eukprot:Selendium_serpulae@DN6431_c1_g1_i9.p1